MPTHALELPDPAADVVDRAHAFASLLEQVDRGCRRQGITVAPTEVRDRIVAAFRDLIARLGVHDATAGSTPQLRAKVREAIAGWMWRSRYWSRSYLKPHGYPGDYRIIEWMYDLETDACEDPTQPAIVNCLDHLYWCVESVQSVCERRRWFADLLGRERIRRGPELRVLDIATGGGRYLRDFLERCDDTNGIEITLVDQDASAIAFCRTSSLAAFRDRVVTHCAPITRLHELQLPGPYDVIISAGLLDYLDDASASALISLLAGKLRTGGALAISNFHPQDPSRPTKDWIVDWPLVFRDEAECARLFPAGLAVQTRQSDNQALTYALARA